jgi:hypothetical protein
MESTRQLQEKIPDVHQMAIDGISFDPLAERDLLLKSHFVFGEEHPHFALTASFIYIVRNPRDVILSNSRYPGANGGPDVDKRRFVLEFIRHRGVKKWKDFGYGTWAGHVASWLKASESFPHLFIRYEDLNENSEAVLSRVLDFLGAPLDEKRITEAVNASSRQEMRKLENEERKTGEKRGVGNEFVGNGESNQSLAFLGDDVEDLYSNTFANTAGLFNYR